MTLVIGKAANGRIQIVSDTKISWPTHGPNLPRADISAREIGKAEDGCLKSVVVSPDVCICWAGDLHFADQAFREIWEGRVDLRLEAVRQHLLRWHRASNRETDFMIAAAGDADVLVRISGGDWYQLQDVGWLGSSTAATRFNDLMSNSELASSAEDRVHLFVFQLDDHHGKFCDPILSEMTQTMCRLVQEGSCADVGDFAIPVARTDSGFRYFFYFSVDARFVPPRSSNTWETVDLGNPTSGGYTFEVTELTHDGVRLPIVHFLQARHALTFSDRSRGVPRAVKHDRQSELVKALEHAAEERRKAAQDKLA